MPTLRISTGTDNFRELVTTSDVFVDKTLFIQEIIDAGEKAIMFTRPRRWGKSLALDTLRTFLAIEVDENGIKKTVNSNRVLFEGGQVDLGLKGSVTLAQRKIAEEYPQYLKMQGEFPVIYVNFKDVKHLSYIAVENAIRDVIVNLYEHFKYLNNSTKISDNHKTKFNNCLNGIFADYEKSLEYNADKISLKDSLKFLTELLNKHHDQKVYILVDEADKPVNYFFEQGIDEHVEDRKQVAALVTSIFGRCGKSNNYLEKIVLTGIFDVFLRSGNSDFNNLETFGIGDVEFSSHFGFTEQEITDQLLNNILANADDEKRAEILNRLKSWYNGYQIPVESKKFIEVYVAWPVMLHIATLVKDIEAFPKNYWEESGANLLLDQFRIPDSMLDVLREISDGQNCSLSKPGKRITRYLDQEIDEEFSTFLLFNTGYLTLVNYPIEDELQYYRLPNKEVTHNFRKSVLKQWLQKNYAITTLDGVRSLSNALSSTEQFIQQLQNLLVNVIGDRSEAYFQMVTGGAIEFAYLSTNRGYKVLAELASGTGRIDNIFYPQTNINSPVIIHEYKKIDKTRVGEVAVIEEQAIWQIFEKGYLSDPITRKDVHPLHHKWQNIEIRGIVFVKDDTSGKWSVFCSRNFVFTIEGARKVHKFFNNPVVRKALELDNPRKNAQDRRAEFLRKYIEEDDFESTENLIECLIARITNPDNPLLEDIKKKIIEIAKTKLTNVGEDKLNDVASYIIDNFGLDPKSLKERIENQFKADIEESVLSDITGYAPKAKKARTEAGSELTTHHAVPSISKFWLKYYGSAIDAILSMRLGEEGLGSVLCLQSYCLEIATIESLLDYVLRKSIGKKSLLPINIEGRHWAGFIFTFGQEFLEITYVDSENHGLANKFSSLITGYLEVAGYESRLTEVFVERQRYSNCGPELIENFLLLLTGKRLLQEEAVARHSQLMERALLNNNDANDLMLLPKHQKTKFSVPSILENLLRYWKFRSSSRRLSSILRAQKVTMNWQEALDDDNYHRVALLLHPDKGCRTEDFQFFQSFRENYHNLDTGSILKEFSQTLSDYSHKAMVGARGLSICTDCVRSYYFPNFTNIWHAAFGVSYYAGSMFAFKWSPFLIGGASLYQIYNEGMLAGLKSFTLNMGLMSVPVLCQANPWLVMAYGGGISIYAIYDAVTNIYNLYNEIALSGGREGQNVSNEFENFPTGVSYLEIIS